MSSDLSISLEDVHKDFQIYEKPVDRLKQFFLPKVQKLLGVGVSRYFKPFVALSGVSFSVRRGETVGIVGKNGAGKSTLLQVICGTLSPSGGKIQVGGRIAALLELGSGFNLDYTGKENIYLNAALLGLTKHQVDALYESIVQFADIGDFIDQPLKTYSSGMVVRLAFAVAINVTPDILIIDEALAVGDELFQRKCFSRIESLKKQGITILFVSHSANQVVQLCDRAIFMDAGQILAVGEPKDIVKLYQKFLYGSHAVQADIRNQLLADATDVDECVPDSTPLKGGERPQGKDEEFFDPYLTSENHLDYEMRGGEIRDLEIQTLQGTKVNNLKRGNTYSFNYKAVFHKRIEHVRFGMSCRSVTGQPLGGAYTHSSIVDAIPCVDAGQVVEVRFSFDCHLNPGTYFLNAGIFGHINGSEGYIHRRVDAVAFRVMPIPNNIETEPVSLAFKANVQVVK